MKRLEGEVLNVLEKLRAAEEQSQKEKDIHEKGLVSVLKQIHDELDAAVCDAYGWPHDLDDEEILQKLVHLNHQRAAEESQGKIRWLRPEFQNPDGQQETQGELIDTSATRAAIAAPAKPAAKVQWPTSLPDRVTAVRTALSQQPSPADVATISNSFKGGRKRATAVEERLGTLVAVGQARRTGEGRYVA